LSINFKKHEIVVPGDLLAEGDFHASEGTYLENNKIFSSILGLAGQRGRNIFVVPLEGIYVPKVGDVVIGKILNASPNGSRADINSLYSAAIFPEHAGRNRLNSQENIFEVGDYVIAKIISFDRTHDPFLGTNEEGLGKLSDGRIIKISPAKVPRLIGKKGSMIKMIKDETKARIKIGQNGLIWFSIKDEKMGEALIKIIRKIERESHTTGLTDRIKKTIKKLGEKNSNVSKRRSS
jgi:exosome complex component RRP4